jgi:lipopolysaccharide heptosyltransferase II
MSAAVFPSLRRSFPAARIDLLTSENARPIADLLAAAGWVDTVWRMPLLGRTAAAYRRTAGEFRRQQYDAAVDLRGDARNVMLMWLAGATTRVGMAGGGLTYLLTDVVDMGGIRHQAEQVAELVRRLGVEVVEPWPRLPVPAENMAAAGRWLAGQGIAADRPLCAFHLGAFYPAKVWPLGRFAEVAHRLGRKAGAQIVVVGGPDEAAAGRELAEQAGRAGVTVAVSAGQTSLPVTAAILARCAAFLGNDSGPAHLAAAVGCPAIVLFGPSDPDQYRPLGPRVVIMRPRSACAPACDKACARPASHCMLDHTVDAVASAAESLVRQWAPRGAAATEAAGR